MSIESLNSEIQSALDFLEEDFLPFLIVGHYDADGLISSAIIARVLFERRIPFVLRIVKELDPSELKESTFSKIIITDFQLKEELAKVSESKKILLIDHHLPKAEARRITLVNAHSLGYDGDKEACSSTLAYSIAKAYDDSYVALAPLALAGALEDRQDLKEKREFDGLNKNVLDEAEEAGLISKNLGLVCFSDFNENLADVFSKMFEPFLPKIFSDADKANAFLKECGVSRELIERKFIEISESEISDVCKKIAKALLKEGFDPAIVERILGYNYAMLEHGRMMNLRYLAKALDYVARSLDPEPFVSFFIKDKISKFDFQKFFNEYIKLIKNYLIPNILSKNYNNYKNFLFMRFEARLDTFSGFFANLLSASNISKQAILTCLEREDGVLKLSLRSVKGDSKDLGEIAYTIASKLGGSGGGHRTAAGATIHKDKLNSFLSMLDSELS